jgi:RND family efflux transporter MFP subunit
MEDRLRRMVVRAPFAGRVVEERTEVGQWVQESDPVVLLADLSTVKIRVPVPEKHISALDRQSRAEVLFEALPEETFGGHVSAVIPQADTAARTFPVEVTVPNPDSRILAGMLARVTFDVGQVHPALLVNKDALVPQPEGGGYLVKVEQGVVQIVPVKVLGSHGDRYAVESLGPPLSAGDEIVVRGNERLRPGQKVTTSTSGEKER